jgi:hypothetical protein
MAVDTAITVPVNVLPLIDDTDFKARETSVAYNAAGMDLTWNFVTTAGVMSSTAVTPTTSGVYDWTDAGAAGDAMYKIEIPASGGGTINNNATGIGWFTGMATGILPWRGPTIEFVPANVANAMVNGTEKLQVDVAQFGGTNGTFASGVPAVNTTQLNGTPQTARDIGASVLVGDKTGFSLTQSFPGNFSSLSIDSNGRMDVGKWDGTAIPGVDTAGYPKVTIKEGDNPGEIQLEDGNVFLAEFNFWNGLLVDANKTQANVHEESILGVAAKAAANYVSDGMPYALLHADSEIEELEQINSESIMGVAAQLAAGKVWDEDRSEHTISNSFGQGMTDILDNTNTALPNAAPGASGGLLIAGSNASTTFTGNVALQDGLTITRSTIDQPGVRIIGNGLGSGLEVLSGNGLASDAARFLSVASNSGRGILAAGVGAGPGLYAGGGEDGPGAYFVGGEDSGAGIYVDTQYGHGIEIHGHGTSKHGMLVAGGDAGVSDGINVNAGTGGVPIRGDITGSLSGSVGGFSTGALADLFDTNSGKSYSDAVAGSVVKEVADHATTPSLTAAGIADAVLDELLAGHTATGSLSKAVSDVYDFLNGAPTFAQAMNDQGYTTALASKLDTNVDAKISEIPAKLPSLLVTTAIDDATPSQTSFVLADGPANDNALNGALVIVMDDSNPTSVKKAVGLVKDYDQATKTVTLFADPGGFTFADGNKVDVIASGVHQPLW